MLCDSSTCRQNATCAPNFSSRPGRTYVGLSQFAPYVLFTTRMVLVLNALYISTLGVTVTPFTRSRRLNLKSIVTRDEREGRGPLEGLRAGLKVLPPEVEAAYVTSCDAPLLVPGFVGQMLDFTDGFDIAVMEIDGFAHPLSAVYCRTTLPYVEDLLARDRLRPAFLFDAVRTRRRPFHAVLGSAGAPSCGRLCSMRPPHWVQ